MMGGGVRALLSWTKMKRLLWQAPSKERGSLAGSGGGQSMLVWGKLC